MTQKGWERLGGLIFWTALPFVLAYWFVSALLIAYREVKHGTREPDEDDISAL